MKRPIGVFDSGYGGLSVFKSLQERLPQYDFIYLGDNARAPYGNRSFETVYEYTLEAVQWLFQQQCPLIILACNTASAKALRTIQQKDLPLINPQNRVLGVIRPTAEVIGHYSTSGAVGILGTSGTVLSQSYPIEIAHFFPNLKVYQQACPMWVNLIENQEQDTEGAAYFFKQDIEALMAQAPNIDTLLLACTHYPLIIHHIQKYLPKSIKILSQGALVAASLEDYLVRHPEMDNLLSKGATRSFYTTDSIVDFETHGSLFLGASLKAHRAIIAPI